MLLATYYLFFFNDPATTEISTLSLHDALPICLSPAGHWRWKGPCERFRRSCPPKPGRRSASAAWQRVWPARLPLNAERRSEEHTSELQSLTNLVCRLLLEKKKKKQSKQQPTTL